MKLFKISQTQNRGYDTYDSAVVCAEDEEAARLIHPSGREDAWDDEFPWGEWANSPTEVTVDYLGEASSELLTAGVICASFNAG